jgi:hypothetical protein
MIVTCEKEKLVVKQRFIQRSKDSIPIGEDSVGVAIKLDKVE